MEIPYAVRPRPDTGLYNAKMGIWLFLASEVMLFGALFSSYILLRVNADPGTWPLHLLNVRLGALNTVVLILSSVMVVFGWASLKMNDFRAYKRYQGVTLLCALTFLCIKSYEYRDKFNHYEVQLKNGTIYDGHIDRENKDTNYFAFEAARKVDSHADLMLPPAAELKLEPARIPMSKIKDRADGRGKEIENYGPWHSSYLAVYFVLTGLHALHVIGGAIVIFAIWGPLAKLWKTDPERYINRVEISGLFWHFVDLVWIFLFPVLYLL
jgi:cytochrome c oxidase subunit 3